MDCRIEGLECLHSLHTLNLASNQITKIQGLGALHSLCKLNLGFNLLTSLEGIEHLQGVGYALKDLDVRGNAIQGVDQLYYLAGIVNLRLLHIGQNSTSTSNPLCSHPDLRKTVFQMLPSLVGLDNSDAQNTPLIIDAEQAPGLQSYLDVLKDASELAAALETSRQAPPGINMAPGAVHGGGDATHAAVVVHTPRIDRALDDYRRRNRTDTGDDSNWEGADEGADDSKYHARAARSHRILYLHKQRELQTAPPDSPEAPAKGLNHEASRAGMAGNAGTRHSGRSAIPIPQAARRSHYHHQRYGNGEQDGSSTPPGSLSPSEHGDGHHIDLRFTSEDHALSSHTDIDTDDGVTIQLGQELFEERERRAKAERTARELVKEIQSSRDQNAQVCKEHESTLDAISQLQQALNDSETRTNRFRDLLVSAEEDAANSTRLKTQQEDTIHSLEDGLKKSRVALQERDQSYAQYRDHCVSTAASESKHNLVLEKKNTALSCELDVYKRSIAHAKKQIHKLHELLAVREDEHRATLVGKVSIDGPEVAAKVADAKTTQQTTSSEAFNELQIRLSEKDRQYNELENELRSGLQYEGNRYKQVQVACAAATSDASKANAQLQTAIRNEEKMKSMVTEMTQLVTHQQSVIQKFAEKKHKQGQEHKTNGELLAACNTEKETAEEQAVQLAKDLEKATMRATNLETVVSGLRDERNLWSRELAAQGASLAADRGKLESRVSTLAANLEAAKQESANYQEAAMVKTKLVEDQNDSLRKLKISLSERDRELKAVRDEFSRRERDLEDRLEAERGLSQQLHTDLEVAHEKKTTSRQQLSDALGELEAAKRAEPKLKDALKAKELLIDQVEMEVGCCCTLSRMIDRQHVHLLWYSTATADAAPKYPSPTRQRRTHLYTCTHTRAHTHLIPTPLFLAKPPSAAAWTSLGQPEGCIPNNIYSKMFS